MREFKYRLYVKNKQPFIPCGMYDTRYVETTRDYIDKIAVRLFNSKLDRQACFNTGDVGVMQAVGLQDKSGVAIYEGDIVEVYCPRYNDKKEPHTVEYINASFRYVHSDGNNVPCGCYHSKEVEIIGNIYQGYKVKCDMKL